MNKIVTFTIKNETIILNDATSIQYHSNKCNYIKNPYVLCTAYMCKDYVLLLELQGFNTDKVVEPTREEIGSGRLDYSNPYFADCWHELFDNIEIKEDHNEPYLIGSFESNEPVIYKERGLERFHICKVDDRSWREIDLSIATLYQQDLTKWSYFIYGWIKNNVLLNIDKE